MEHSSLSEIIVVGHFNGQVYRNIDGFQGILVGFIIGK